MASKQFLVTLAVVAIVFPSLALATDHMVGDGSGWTTDFNYTAWAATKEFRVGDNLIFMYAAGSHNVFKVNGTAFQACEKPPLDQALKSGNDIIPLLTTGKKWYICGVAQHCAEKGQKLVINVLPASIAPTAPGPGGDTNSANGIVASGYRVFGVVMTVIGAFAMA